jgi:hypothetical protein
MKKFGDKVSRLHFSSEKVVWETTRLEPVMTEEFKSCLLIDVSNKSQKMRHDRSPEDGTFDALT